MVIQYKHSEILSLTAKKRIALKEKWEKLTYDGKSRYNWNFETYVKAKNEEKLCTQQ